MRVTDVRQLQNLSASTRLKVNGRPKTAGDYAGLVVAGGTPLLEALALLGQTVEIEDDPK
jgi:hypothetical protein